MVNYSYLATMRTVLITSA